MKTTGLPTPDADDDDDTTPIRGDDEEM